MNNLNYIYSIMITKKISFYRKAILSLLIAFSYLNSWGQIENKVWHLDEEVKIDFNDTPPTVSFGHNFSSNEGIATVTDETGNVIFTATDIAIYDINDEVIENGNGIDGSPSGSSAQSPIVLQNPANPTEYYIFYIADHVDDVTEGDFKYSILESCTENNELAIGEIKNVQIPGNYSERLHIVEINKGDYWILTTEIFQNKLYAFKIDENGIDTNPVVSNLGGGEDKQIGKLKINNSKNTLAWSTTFGNSAGVRLMDFDISTGKVDNPRTIFSGSGYGLVWSPNDEFLYFTDIYIGSEVLSFNIASNDLKILDNKPGNYKFGDLAMSPSEDAILVSNLDEKSLDRITNINEGGDFEHNYLSFGSNIKRLETGLQNQVMHYPISSYEKPELDLNSVYFIGIKSESINLIVNDQFNDVSWSDGQIGNTATFSEEGIYTVEAYYNCCLVETEFEIIIEQVFTPECDQIFDGSNIMDDIIFYHDFSGDGVDQSMNGLNAIVENSINAQNRFLEDDEALSFNKNSNVYIPSNEKLKIDYPFSFSLWAFFESDAQFDNAIFDSNFVPNSYHGIGLFRTSSGEVSLFVGNGIENTGPDNRKNIVSTNAEVNIEEWFHLVFVMDGPGNGSIYVNGCKVETEYVGSGLWEIAYSDDPAVFGKYDSNTLPGSEDHKLLGKLDDFYFWNRSITEEEVLYLYDRFEVPEIELEETYTILNGQDEISIDLPFHYTGVLWSDGQTGNSVNFSSEGTYQVEAYYDCHLVCFEFEVKKEIIDFEQECDQIFDNSNLEDNLLLHYTLDGNTLDSGPNMIHGQNNGGEIDSDRYGDQSAYSFDGNSNIMIPHDDSYKVQFPISVSTWVKWESDAPNKNGVFNTNFEQNNYHGVFMLRLANSGKLFFGYGTGTGGITLQNRRAIISETETELDKWYHIAGIINGPNDFHLFIDGCEETFSYSGDENPMISYTDNNGFLGKLDNSNIANSNDLIGAIDDFYFWNRIISEEEIFYLYDRFEVPELELQETYTILNGQDEITIDLPIDYTDVLWSDGQTGNSGNFSSEGIYQVEAYYNCHLVCFEFEVKKEIIDFEQECDQIFDNSTLENKLLLNYNLDGGTLDNGPNQIHGLLNGASLSENRNGETDKCYSFEAGKNVIIPNDLSYKVQFPISFSVWVMWNSDDQLESGVFNTNFENNNYHGVFLARSHTTGQVTFGYGGGLGGISVSNRRVIVSDNGFELNNWYHVVGTMNSPTDFELYVNGCKETFLFSGDQIPEIGYNQNEGFLGKFDNNNSFPSNDLKGKIDDFYLWNRSITEEEVLYLYDRFQVPEFDLLDLYNFCEEEQVDITIDPIFENITWSDGFEGNERIFTEAGIYSLQGFYNCHIVCHEFEVLEVPVDITLGDNIVTCEDQVTLSTSVIADWNTGEISNSITVTQSGIYIANYESACGILNDTVVIDLLSNQSISLEETYEFCLGSSITLSVEDGYESVLWSDGTSGNSVEIFESGVYQVIAEETVCPSDTHIFIVMVQDTILEIAIVDSITLCDEVSTIITVPSGDYQSTWNGVSSEISYIAEGDQDVQLTLSNECDEDQYFINVNSVISEPIEKIVTTICRDDSLLLMAPIDAELYSWSTTDTISSIWVKEEGDYSLIYSNEGCTFETEIATIEVNSCIDCEFYLPNIISTRSTTGNDEFLIKSNHLECLNDITVTIYDRWGSKVFDSPAIEPWDGFYKNKKVASGVFVVWVAGVFEGSPISITADLTVIH